MSALVKNPLDRLLEPVARCLPADVAREVVQLRVDSQTQDRIDELAAKAAEGTLSPPERQEYEDFVEAIDVVSIFQAKLRKMLAESGA
jgi:hypothetical protein